MFLLISSLYHVFQASQCHVFQISLAPVSHIEVPPMHSNRKLHIIVFLGGWCAEHRFAATGDKNQYLQFDLGKQMAVDAVATQGSHLLENWVKSYNLRYSDDGISWEYYMKVFIKNLFKPVLMIPILIYSIFV